MSIIRRSDSCIFFVVTTVMSVFREKGMLEVD